MKCRQLSCWLRLKLICTNGRHLANAQILRRLEREALNHGWPLPKVCTPAELMGESPYEDEADA